MVLSRKKKKVYRKILDFETVVYNKKVYGLKMWL